MGNQNYDDDDDIVTLQNANGDEIDFTEIAGIAYRGNFYAILQPVELLEGMSEDEALVFKVSKVKGDEKFEIELDDKIIDAVFAEYNKLLDEAEGKKALKKGSSKNFATKVKDAAVTAVSTVFKIIGIFVAVAVALVGLLILIQGLTGNETDATIVGIVILVIDLAVFLFVRHKIKKKNKNK